MARKNNQPLRPTDGGLEVLRVLWDRGPSTVRQVHETLARSKAITFNTTRMRIVHGKGLLARVRRLLGEPSGERSRSGWLPGFVILVSILVAVLAAQTGAGTERPEQPSKQSVEPSQQVKSARIAQLIDQLGSEPHDQR